MPERIGPPAVPGRNAGEVFIPSLGKSFMQIELQTSCYEYSELARARYGKEPYVPGRAGPPLEFAAEGHARLRAGAEMALTGLLLIGPAAPVDTEVILRVNKREVVRTSSAVLRLHSQAFSTGARLQRLSESIPVGPLQGDIRDVLLGLQAVVQRALEVPVLGYGLTVPQQIRDDDYIYVDGLPPDNALFLMGIVKRPLGT